MAKCTLPEAMLAKVGAPTLTASIGNTVLGSQKYTKAGEFTFTADVPPSVLRPEGVTVDFSLDKYAPAGTLDKRELGLVISRVALESK